MAYARSMLVQAASDLAAFYDRVAVLVGRPVAHEVILPVTVPAFVSLNGDDSISPPGETDEADGTGGPTEGDAAGDADLVRIITSTYHPHLLWVHEHLQHLSSHAGAITAPATHVAEQRRVPWWR